MTGVVVDLSAGLVAHREDHVSPVVTVGVFYRRVPGAVGLSAEAGGARVIGPEGSVYDDVEDGLLRSFQSG